MMMTPAKVAALARRFACAGVIILAGLIARAEPMISEFMAANTNVHADEDGAQSDWIELHNPDEMPVNLDGWYLTDSASNKTKWRLPAVTIPAGGYLVVFASSKDRKDPGAPLHTNFALSAGGEYLGLIQPDGTTPASEFSPGFPAQSDNISYGRVITADGVLETGFLRRPTPGESNGGVDALLLIETVTFSPPGGVFTGTLSVDLAGAGPGQEIRFVTASGRDAALAKVTAESPVYTGALTLDATTVIRAAVFAINGAIGGATTQAHYIKRADDLAGFNSKLPVLVLDDLGAGELLKDGIDHPSWTFGYTPKEGEPGLGERAADFATPLVATVRGSSSADFPKKGYNIKLRDALGGKRTLPLFGLPSYEHWALIAPWAHDQNFINNSFVYELSNRIGRWAPRTRLIEMFFNTGGDDLDSSDYAGIYVLADRIRINKGRVDIHELSSTDVTEPAVTGGYLFKIDLRDDDEIGWRTEHGVPPPDTEEQIVLVAPDADDIAPAQLNYIKGYVQEMENALHADRESGWSQRTYLDYIDRPAWVDHHMLNALVNNPDALYRSAYFTKPRNGKLQAGPVWDFDRALGSYWDDRSDVITTWSGVGGHIDLWTSGWWGILAEDPEFVQAWAERWQQLRATHFSTPSLTALAQTLATTIGIDAANRDGERWPENASPHGSYEAQIEVLKDWLARRAAWIDSQFAAPPTVANGGGMMTFTAPEGAVLAYTLDGTDPRMLGGEVAPNTQMTSEPLSVPASSNVHVRSYKAGLQESVPGSPWSSVVSGPSASPLAPIARLVNLSSRAFAGSNSNALLLGVAVADTTSKSYLARGIGPGLAAFGATDTIGAPRVRVLNATGVELESNAGWQNHPNPDQLRNAAQTVGAFQLVENSADSAVVASLSPGSHLIEIATGNGQAGTALAELYELDAKGRTAQLSLRARVTPSSGLVGGFVIEGTARKRLLIRAVGPTLTELGLADALSDPVLTIYSSAETVATNDRWDADEKAGALETARKRVGAFPLAAEGEDAAILVTLAAGAYTVEVKGKDDGEGLVMLEIYDLL
jgi:hypothetical protein